MKRARYPLQVIYIIAVVDAGLALVFNTIPWHHLRFSVLDDSQLRNPIPSFPTPCLLHFRRELHHPRYDAIHAREIKGRPCGRWLFGDLGRPGEHRIEFLKNIFHIRRVENCMVPQAVVGTIETLRGWGKCHDFFARSKVSDKAGTSSFAMHNGVGPFEGPASTTVICSP